MCDECHHSYPCFIVCFKSHLDDLEIKVCKIQISSSTISRHQLVDWLPQLSASKGINVTFSTSEELPLKLTNSCKVFFSSREGKSGTSCTCHCGGWKECCYTLLHKFSNCKVPIIGRCMVSGLSWRIQLR